MKKHTLLGICLAFGFLIITGSCSKDEDLVSSPNSNSNSSMCDLSDYTGQWNFILNGDPASAFIGQIDKFNDGTLNLTYQPDTEYYYFLQADVNCEDHIFVYKQLPAGNHGTTTIEGTITTTDLEYTCTKVLDTPYGIQTTVTHITGTKIP